MPLSLRAAGIAVALLAAGVSPAAAQAAAPPTLGGTELIAPPPEGEAGGATVDAARCSASSGFAAYSATGTAVNGEYGGPYSEDAVAQLGPGGLSEDLEARPLRAAGHLFTIESPQGTVFGTQRVLTTVAGAGICAKPYFDSALYLSYTADTNYSARIETPGGVYVDRGEGSVIVNIVELLDRSRSATTQTSFPYPAEAVTHPLRRSDCRGIGFAVLAYPGQAQCRRAADANRAA